MLNSNLEMLVTYLVNKNMAVALKKEFIDDKEQFRFKVYVYWPDGHTDTLKGDWSNTVESAALRTFNVVTIYVK